MGVSIEIKGLPEVLFHLDNFDKAVDSVVEGLAYAVDTVVLPEVYSRSTSVWNVRTGRYSMGWSRQIEPPDSVKIQNDAPYSHPLETGWTTRKGTFKSSPGVVFPAIEATMKRIVEVIQRWLKIRAGL